MTDIEGTPISRGGGYLIRVGWRAAGYSVDRKTEKRYWLIKGALLVLAILVGIAAVLAAKFVLFEIVAPIVSGHTSLIKNYPGIWQLMIYLLTTVCGGLIYLQIIAVIGRRMVRGFAARDEGMPFLEQRRLAAVFRKRDIFLILIPLAVIWFVPIGFTMVLKVFLSLLIGARLAESVYFRFVSPGKNRAAGSR